MIRRTVSLLLTLALAGALAVLGAAPQTAWAHGGEIDHVEDLRRAWTFEPGVLLPMGLAVGLYAAGTARVWRRAGIGHGIRAAQVAAFAAGIAALVAALVSPLDALSGQLFAAHMTQHMVLMFVAAPLLVLSNFPVAALWALPRHRARGLGQWWANRPRLARLWRALTQPFAAALLFSVTLWGWHLPAFYQAALRHETLHGLEHAAFVVTAALFWWPLFRLVHQSDRSLALGAFGLFAALLQSGALGALLTLSGRPWYPAYEATTARWGLTALEDQQLGGAIMWVPGHLIFLIVIAAVLYRWLDQQPQPREFSSARTR